MKDEAYSVATNTCLRLRDSLRTDERYLALERQYAPSAPHESP